jgi:hypothetical protein
LRTQNGAIDSGSLLVDAGLQSLLELKVFLLLLESIGTQSNDQVDDFVPGCCLHVT